MTQTPASISTQPSRIRQIAALLMLGSPLSKHWLRWFAIILFCPLLLGCITSQVAQATSPIPAVKMSAAEAALATADNPAPLCRLGINVSSFNPPDFYISDFEVAPLRLGWYIDYRATQSAPANNGAEYAMVMGVSDDHKGHYGYSPTGAELDKLVAAYPGGIYIIGNEPDRRLFQGDILPENYAYIFHDAYTEIKSKDPTARIFAGAIVQATPLRLQYLDSVLAAYQARYGTSLPTDGWAIHGFLLNERSCTAYDHKLSLCWGADIPPGSNATDGDIRAPEDNARLDLFTQRIVSFRTWMAKNGYRNTPLYLSEYGVLMPPVFGFPSTVVNNYMSQTFDYLLNTKDETLGYPADDNRLVQRLSWFSTFDPNFNGQIYQSADGSDSMKPPFVLSSMGQHFQELASQIEDTSDLAVLSVEVVASPSQVVATVANSGNRLTPTQATLRFYSGETLQTAQQIGKDITVMLPGCGATKTVSEPWSDVGSENAFLTHVWAQVSQQNFPDANPDNDVISNDAIVNAIPLYLPFVTILNP